MEYAYNRTIVVLYKNNVHCIHCTKTVIWLKSLDMSKFIIVIILSIVDGIGILIYDCTSVKVWVADLITAIQVKSVKNGGCLWQH